jgi:hypothetical protein
MFIREILRLESVFLSANPFQESHQLLFTERVFLADEIRTGTEQLLEVLAPSSTSQNRTTSWHVIQNATTRLTL